jgi:hypothetical protein
MVPIRTAVSNFLCCMIARLYSLACMLSGPTCKVQPPEASRVRAAVAAAVAVAAGELRCSPEGMYAA